MAAIIMGCHHPQVDLNSHWDKNDTQGLPPFKPFKLDTTPDFNYKPMPGIEKWQDSIPSSPTPWPVPSNDTTHFDPSENETPC